MQFITLNVTVHLCVHSTVRARSPGHLYTAALVVYKCQAKLASEK